MKQAGVDYKMQLQEWNMTYLPDIMQSRPGMLHNYFGYANFHSSMGHYIN